jgi:PAS domain S-box-containing protein
MSKLSVVQARNAVIVALVLGLIFSVVQIGFDLRNERGSLDHQVSQMLETIHASASRSVFNVDRGLAENVVDSLLKYLPIYSAKLVDDFGEVLAVREKERPPTRYPWLTDYFPVYRSDYTLVLKSDQSDRSLGQIEIKVFGGEVVENFVERSALVIVFGTLRNFLLAITLTAIFHYTLTQPLTNIAHQISFRKPSDVEAKLIETPSGHVNDELGELTEKLNYYLKTADDLFKELSRAELETRQSQARFKIFAETGSDWFWEMDSDLRFVSLKGSDGFPQVMNRAEPPIGLTRWEALKNLLPDFEIDNHEKWNGHNRDMMSHKPFRNFEYAVNNPDGMLAHVRLNGKPVFDERGVFTGYYGTGSDITREAKSTRDLEASEARYRALFNNAQLGITRSNISDGKIIQANERAAEILGYESAADLIENYPGSDAWVVAELRQQMQEIILEDGYLQEIQAEVYCPDASRRWIRSSLTAHLDESVIDSFFVDATEQISVLDELANLNNELEIRVANRTRALSDEVLERTRAEEALRRSEERLLTAIEAMPDGFVLYDANDQLVLANSRMKEFTSPLKNHLIPGRTYEEIYKDAVFAGLIPDAVGHEEEWISKAMSLRAKPGPRTREARTVDGRWLRLTDTRTKDGYHVGVRTDITELKEAHEDLKEAQSNLMQKERLAALGQLAATVSHELRNPLGAIQTSIYFLRHQFIEAGEKEVQAIDRIERNIQRCDRIIDELLDFTRNRELNFEKIPFDIWLHDTIEDMEIPTEISVQENLTTAGTELCLDAEYFRRVIINLIENACQAMTKMDGSEGLPERTLTVSTSVSENLLNLNIQDTGVGMTENVRARMFEAMFSTKGFGVGLGLAVVQQIILRHKSDISVASTPGQGTGVTINLPLANPEADALVEAGS